MHCSQGQGVPSLSVCQARFVHLKLPVWWAPLATCPVAQQLADILFIAATANYLQTVLCDTTHTTCALGSGNLCGGRHKLTHVLAGPSVPCSLTILPMGTHARLGSDRIAARSLPTGPPSRARRGTGNKVSAAPTGEVCCGGNTIALSQLRSPYCPADPTQIYASYCGLWHCWCAGARLP
jgi:hypothetical protein